jgi:predicted phage terminase large subunit-like protein
MQEMVAEELDETGRVTRQDEVYEVFQRVVEDRGDGTGMFLWPRQQRADGKWFGFNQTILAQKRAKYLDRTQFRAQYYNDPNDPDAEAISSDNFQQYNRKHIVRNQGEWTYNRAPLNIFAAIDFAFSLSAKADYTALVVIGVDADGNIYILDIDRFRSNKISDYYKSIFDAHAKWGFRKLRAEVTIAQDAIVEELKNRLKQNGLALSIDRYRPNRHQGNKEERMHAVLAPRYENMAVWHYESGLMMELEDELRQQRPRHDDIKDALANAIDISVPPRQRKNQRERNKVVYNARFGGVSAA